MPRLDKEEMRAYHREWYARNRQKVQQRIYANKRGLVAWFNEYKGTLKCVRCGESHPACIDFHHRDPTTKNSVLSEVTRLGWSKRRILAEIEKCDVLCANCHRKLHWDENNGF